MKRGVLLEAEYPHPPDVVWRALTDPRALATWLMNAPDFRPVVGHRFRFSTTPQPGWDGTVDCEVTDVEPGRRLAYTWKGGSRLMGQPTLVSFTLTPLRDGAATRLRLEHTGFRGAAGFVLSVMLGSGWKRMALRRGLPQVIEQLAAGVTPSGESLCAEDGSVLRADGSPA